MPERYRVLGPVIGQRLLSNRFLVTADEWDWFGPSIDAWYENWRKKAPMLEALEAEAAGM